MVDSVDRVYEDQALHHRVEARDRLVPDVFSAQLPPLVDHADGRVDQVEHDRALVDALHQDRVWAHPLHLLLAQPEEGHDQVNREKLHALLVALLEQLVL